MDQDIKRQFDMIHRKLNELAANQREEKWVSASFVTDLTGWDNEKLRQARNQKIIEFKRSPGGGWQYKLESIPDKFIKHKQAS